MFQNWTGPKRKIHRQLRGKLHKGTRLIRQTGARQKTGRGRRRAGPGRNSGTGTRRVWDGLDGARRTGAGQVRNHTGKDGLDGTRWTGARNKSRSHRQRKTLKSQDTLK
ncbi:hypothetical protein SKAU_G00233970 [Synaphobranchus kaupii]|uniref:Uncharacterized protein n=1 Tax=Synaphobranchus kaupii TaxID=118154 RepID=A0A9Q1F6M3_SYNKA|nr:hypothetical protein SKAU_G00233970 [Synaphobranchus kaupii]